MSGSAITRKALTILIPAIWKSDARPQCLAYVLGAHAPFAVGYRPSVFKPIHLALGKTQTGNYYILNGYNMVL
jgi:hypothetical protein